MLAKQARLQARHLAGVLAKLVESAATNAPAAVAHGDPDQLLTSEQAGISRRTWRRLISTGELRGCLVGREYLARRADVRAYIDRCTISTNGATTLRLELAGSA